MTSTAKVLTLVAVALWSSAPTASADQYDYVSYLDANGVLYSSVSDIIDIGKVMCRALRTPLPIPNIVSAVQENGYTAQETGLIVLGASKFMCPDTLPYLQASANAAQSGHPA